VYWVYLLRCADGTLYTGYARDPKNREKVHNDGRGAKYTASRRPVSLVYYEPVASISAALKREHQVKRWTRARKEALIRGLRQPAVGPSRSPPTATGAPIAR
jgi:putative endonuclease